MSPVAVIVVVLVYIALLFAIAWLAGRHADNAAFFTGNRRSSWLVAAFSMITAAMSGVTYLSVPGSVATDSFSYMQMVLGFTVGQLIVAFVLVPLFYRMRVISLYQYLDLRFGVTSQRTGAWFFFLSKMLGAALRVYIVCAVMQLLVFDRFGLPFAVNAVVTMLFVWLYTRRGGVKSLIWTDSFKTLCLVASLVLTILALVRGLGLTTGEALREVASSDYARIFFFDDPSSERYFWKMFVAGIVLLVAMTGLDQDMMQRNLSCRSPRDAQKNILLTALCQIVVILLFLTLGALLYLYAAHVGMELPLKSDQLFSQVAVNGGLPLHVGLLFVLGMMASTYSSAGSALTALTTSFTVDLLDATRHGDEARLTQTRRRVHALMAVGMTLLVLLFGHFGNDSVINLFFKVAGYTYGPILGMFLFGICTRRRIDDRWLPLVAVAAPLLSALLQYVAQEMFGYRIGFELLVYNAAITMAGMWLLGRERKNA